MRFTGTVYRAHNPEWAWSPISGEGARRHGGRFNRPGVPALYTSLSPLTALLEASPLGRPMQPITLCAYKVDARPVFDSRNPTMRVAHRVDAADLACPGWNREMLEGKVPASQSLLSVCARTASSACWCEASPAAQAAATTTSSSGDGATTFPAGSG